MREPPGDHHEGDHDRSWREQWWRKAFCEDPMRARRPVRIGVIAVAALILACLGPALVGCNQVMTGHPRAIQLPLISTPSLSSPPSPPAAPEPTSPRVSSSTESTDLLPSTPVELIVYFVQNEKVVATHRAGAAPSAAAAVRALLDGPTPAERRAGMSTSIPAATGLHTLSLRNGLATIDLTAAFAEDEGSVSAYTRLAQVVHTLTQFRTVRTVVFQLDGKPVTAFGGEGIVLDHPQTRADYERWTPVVLVESPTFGDTVRSPMRVTGTANTFEAVFRLQLVDAAERTLVDGQVQATSGTGTRGGFDVAMSYDVPADTTGTLIAWYASPADGSRVVVSVTPLGLRP
jgi:germination protein M